MKNFIRLSRFDETLVAGDGENFAGTPRAVAAGPPVSKPLPVGRFHFRFECQAGCTNCCTQKGHVYLSEADIGRIAAHLGATREQFEGQYLNRNDDYPRLNMRLAEDCYFLREGGCSIHEVKPLQCRVFPYWPENVGTRAAWQGLRTYCPGVGVGQLVQIERVRAEAEEYQEAFPDI